MMKKYIIGIISLLLVLFFVFGGYYIYSSNNNSQNTVESLKAKADLEITYLNTTIISMMNKINNISYENYKIEEEEVPAKDENIQNSSGGEQKSSSSSENGVGEQSQGSSRG